jgi:hypothetical protein
MINEGGDLSLAKAAATLESSVSTTGFTTSTKTVFL